MGDDPATSVVDRNLKAHDHPNLYICDASVFPTVGRRAAVADDHGARYPPRRAPGIEARGDH